MKKVISYTRIDYTKEILSRSSTYIEEAINSVGEDLQDTFLDDGSETLSFKNCENEDVLLERAWWLSKPRIVSRQLPTVSARQAQITRQRLLSTIKKPSSVVETLRGKVEGHLKQHKQHVKEF